MPRPQAPVIDMLITREPGADGAPAYRLHLAPASWPGGVLRARLDERREVYPVRKPDVADFDRFMFEADAPYVGNATADGGMQVLAKGRSAVCMLPWLEDLVEARR